MADPKFKYALVATDGVGYSYGKMPGPDDGKPGMAVTGPTGSYTGGYTAVRGKWKPVGLGVRIFDTEKQATDWTTSTEGEEWIARFGSVLLVRLMDSGQ